MQLYPIWRLLDHHSLLVQNAMMLSHLPTIASMLLFVGVTLGAFGAHGLKGSVSPENLEIWKTAVFYHLIHALGLFIIPLLPRLSDQAIFFSTLLLIVGVCLFSGSLYILVLSGARWWGAVTPLGGLCFLFAWAWIGVAAFRGSA